MKQLISHSSPINSSRAEHLQQYKSNEKHHNMHKTSCITIKNIKQWLKNVCITHFSIILTLILATFENNAKNTYRVLVWHYHNDHNSIWRIHAWVCGTEDSVQEERKRWRPKVAVRSKRICPLWPFSRNQSTTSFEFDLQLYKVLAHLLESKYSI